MDVSALLRPEDGLEPLEQRAAEATALLEGRPAPEFKVGDDGVIDMDQASDPAAGRQAAAEAGEPSAGKGVGAAARH